MERALTSHPDVAGAAVVAREDSPGETRLVAYFVPKGDPSAPGGAQALSFGAAARYMVPSAFVRLESLPVTPHGKLDRAPCRRRGARARAYSTLSPRRLERR